MSLSRHDHGRSVVKPVVSARFRVTYQLSHSSREPPAERDFELKPVHVPGLTRGICPNLDDVAASEVVRRVVVAVLVLDATKQREFVVRAHVQFERRRCPAHLPS